MKKLLILGSLLYSANVNAVTAPVKCSDVDNTKTYQAFCVYTGGTKEKCYGYALVEGFGDIPSLGPLISDKPYFIKPADTNINKFVDCKDFNGTYMSSEKPKALLDYAVYGQKSKFNYPSTYQSIYETKGSLFIDLFNLSVGNKQFAESKKQRIIAEIISRTNAKINNLGDSGTLIQVSNITVAESMLLRHLHQGKLYTMQWSSPDGKNIYINIPAY